MPFAIRGCDVTQNIFAVGANSYQPNAWTILQDLHVNLIRVGGGVEGRVLHLNIDMDWNWEANLEAFLTAASLHGIKVYFNEMGTRYNTLFGIVSPNADAGIVGTPITEAKAKIDALAGNNPLGHNFITDPRIWGWSVSNEVDLRDTATLNWTLEVLDYIRAKGGTAWCGSPRDSSVGDWTSSMLFGNTEPLLRGHVDKLELHLYKVGDAIQAQDSGGDVYQTIFTLFKGLLQEAVNGKGQLPVDQLILGEFGIHRGSGQGGFAEDTTRRDYYKGVLDACQSVGWQNVVFHDCFAQQSGQSYLSPMWSLVDWDGSYFPEVAEVVKTYYAGGGGLPPVTMGSANPLPIILAGLAGLVFLSSRRE